MIRISIILVALLCALELLFRITDFGLSWNIDQFGRKANTVQVANLKNTVVVAAGDSFTFGMRLPEDKSYPSQLCKRMNGKKISVVNAGISGHTSTQLRERFTRDVTSYKPTAVIIWIGTNDGMLKFEMDSKYPGKRPFDKPPLLANSSLLTTLDSIPWIMSSLSLISRRTKNPEQLVPRVEVDDFIANIEAMLHETRENRIDNVLLLGLPKVPDSYSRNSVLLQFQRAMHKKYNDTLQKIAKTHRILFIDLWNVLTEEYFLADGLHLTAQGHGVVAEQVIKNFLLNIDAEQGAALDGNSATPHLCQ